MLLNGTVIGVHARPKRLLTALRRLRRAGHIGEFVSVHRQAGAISIACDGGRVCRPLIICDQGVPRLTQQHIAQVPIHPRPPSTHPSFPVFLRASGVHICAVSVCTAKWCMQCVRACSSVKPAMRVCPLCVRACVILHARVCVRARVWAGLRRRRTRG